MALPAPPTSVAHNQTVAPGTSIPLSTLFTYSPTLGDPIVGFDVKETTNSGYLTQGGIRQSSGVLYGSGTFGIPISQIGQWAFVTGAAGTTDTISFNVDAQSEQFSPSVSATVTGQSLPTPPTSVAHNQTVAPGTSIPLSTLFTYSPTLGDPIVGFDVKETTNSGYLTQGGIRQSSGVLYGSGTFGIPISQIGQWAFVTGAAGTTDTISFNVDAQSEQFSPSVSATVTGQSLPTPPTSVAHNQTVAPGTSIPLSTLFTYSPTLGDPIVGFDVKETTNSGYLTQGGIRQSSGVLYGSGTFGIPISQIGQWAFVTGAAGTTDTISFNVDAQSEQFSPSVSATVTGQSLPTPPTSVAHNQTVAPGTSIPLSTLFTYSPTLGDPIVGFDVKETTNSGYLTQGGIRQSSGVLYGSGTFGIPISQIGQWAFVTGAAGTTDTISFNVDAQSEQFSPSVSATVTGQSLPTPPTSVAHNQTVAPGTSIPLSTLFTYSPTLGDPIVGFDVKETTNSGYLTQGGIRQSSGVLYGSGTFGIPISQIGQWAFVTGAAGTTDTISFNVDAQSEQFSPSVSATVTGQGSGLPPPVSAPAAGFDRELFPAHADTMADLIQRTNLSWCGYYLDGPNQGNWTGWLGERQYLQGLGWKLAPLYVGEQDPTYVATWNASHPSDDQLSTTAPSWDQGATDAEQAVEEMSAPTAKTITLFDSLGGSHTTAVGQGFSANSVVYLDWETGLIPVGIDTDYIVSWSKTVAQHGYQPGVYCPATDIPIITPLLASYGLTVQFWAANWTDQPSVPSTTTQFSNLDPSDGQASATSWQYGTGYAIQTINGLLGGVDLDTSSLFGSAPSAMLSIAAANADQNEGNSGSTAFTFTVTRSGDSSTAASVNWAVAGSGTNPANAADFVGGVIPSGTINFTAGDTSPQVITVNVSGDTVAEPSEGFTVTLSGASAGAAIGVASAVGTILNDDAVPPSAKTATDFNGDGKSDILWQNDDGAADVWLMNGTAITQTALAGPNPGPSWHVKGSGDFNGDGKSDILWQNDNGSAAVWLMNGTTFTQAALVGSNPGPSWHVKGSGDFNGDGKSDILWQNDNGSVDIWLMNGATITQTALVGSNPGPSWHVMGSGDFNGDGKSDILWQNDNGSVDIWLMNGATITQTALVGSNPGPSWHVKGSGDFNGDGKSDILWQNDNGSADVWLMNGTTVTQTALVGPNPGPSWHVEGSGDFNGDGKSDILWQNDNGAADVWLMTGATRTGGGMVGSNPGASWHTVDGDGVRFISGASATSTIAATSEDDVFVFTSFMAGPHAISGFNPAHDLIELSKASLANFAAVQAHSTAAGGGTLIGLDRSSSLLVQGVSPGSLHAGDFRFV